MGGRLFADNSFALHSASIGRPRGDEQYPNGIGVACAHGSPYPGWAVEGCMTG